MIKTENTKKVDKATEIIINAANKFDLKIHKIAPNHVKFLITGNSRISKVGLFEQVKGMVSNIPSTLSAYTNNHITDSIAIGLTGILDIEKDTPLSLA